MNYLLSYLLSIIFPLHSNILSECNCSRLISTNKLNTQYFKYWHKLLLINFIIYALQLNELSDLYLLSIIFHLYSYILSECDFSKLNSTNKLNTQYFKFWHKLLLINFIIYALQLKEWSDYLFTVCNFSPIFLYFVRVRLQQANPY